ncbi:MAG: DUF222 domain-containing protein [Candidatus Nanopelagicales bacterium]
MAGTKAVGRLADVGQRTGGDESLLMDSEADREVRFQALMRRWWVEDRPPWTALDWWDAPMRDEARGLLWLTAGPVLAAALADLGRSSRCPHPHEADRFLPDFPTPGQATGWPCACQVVAAAAWEACAAWVAAGAAVAVVDALGPQPVQFEIGEGRQKVEDPGREELAHALRSTIPSMGNRIGWARALTASPSLESLVSSAAISSWAARLVLEHVTGLIDEDAQRVIEEVRRRVLDRVASHRRAYNSAEIGRIARAARLRICPEAEQEARARAFAQRRVQVHHRADGMSTLIADLAESDAHRIHRRLTALAAGLEQDDSGGDAPGHASSPDQQNRPGAHPVTRTRDQVRADLLVDLLLGAPEPRGFARHNHAQAEDSQPGGSRPEEGQPTQDGEPTRRFGRQRAPEGPEISVIVDLPTLLGLAQSPALVPGLGPIPAHVARELAADGRWRAWISDAAGAVTATGSTGYAPSTGLARLVRAREPRCRFPGCRTPSTRCDLDHAIPWPRGSTEASNLGPLCRRHHVLKTHAGWDLEPLAPDSTDERRSGRLPGWRWRTPAGFEITAGAPVHLP